MIALALSLGKTEGRQCRFAETIAFVYMQPWGRHWTLREIDGLFSPRHRACCRGEDGRGTCLGLGKPSLTR